MKVLERYIECMRKGDQAGLADLFSEDGVLHDSSLHKIGQDTMHLEGKMAVEMMFHHKFGFNGGPFPITGVRMKDDNAIWYFIQYNQQVVQVMAYLSEMDEQGRIRRLNIYHL
ncbi:nuclear transport factor 2 family protein [Ruminococcaceae bacterium OttesenSCG-928-D13]|nr:nuclear transport factor 2 family protein [Ruminococcaceae bacterium OttesenSCG-928-D13]